MKAIYGRLSILFCAAVLALASPGVLASKKADRAQELAMHSYVGRLAAGLVVRGDARSLAMAAVINESQATRSWFDGKSIIFVDKTDGLSDASDLRRSALESARDDVLVYVFLLSGNSESSRQSRAEAAARWARLEMDNLAPVLTLRGGVEVLLGKNGEYGRMDVHYVEQLRWIAAAVLENPPNPAEARALYRGEVDTAEKFASSLATALWAMNSMPFVDIVRSCKGDDLDSVAGRRERCRAIAVVMSDKSDTLLGRAIGLAMHANTAEVEEKALVAERRRRHDWQMTQWGLVATENEKKDSNVFLRMIEDRRNSSEIDVMDMMLADAGIPSDPPPTWKSERTLP